MLGKILQSEKDQGAFGGWKNLDMKMFLWSIGRSSSWENAFRLGCNKILSIQSAHFIPEGFHQRNCFDYGNDDA